MRELSTRLSLFFVRLFVFIVCPCLFVVCSFVRLSVFIVCLRLFDVVCLLFVCNCLDVYSRM